MIIVCPVKMKLPPLKLKLTEIIYWAGIVVLTIISSAIGKYITVICTISTFRDVFINPLILFLVIYFAYNAKLAYRNLDGSRRDYNLSTVSTEEHSDTSTSGK